MKKYVIEYSFGENNKIERLVESESDDLESVFMNFNSKEDVKFMDKHNHLYTFKFSAVKYAKIRPYVRPKVYPTKPKGM